MEKEGQSVLASLRFVRAATPDETGLPLLYGLLLQAVPDGRLPERGGLIKLLSEADLSSEQAQLTELMLRAALLTRAAQGVEESAELLRNAIESFEAIGDFDFETVFQKSNKAEAILCGDEAYLNSCGRSRAFFRKRLAELAGARGEAERETAAALLEQSKKEGGSVTSLLCRRETGKGRAWLWAEIFLPVVAAAALGAFQRGAFLIPLLAVSLWEILRVALLELGARLTQPCPVPKLRAQKEIPPSAQTVVLVSALLPEPEGTARLKQHLQKLYVTGGRGAVKVCLLADLKGARAGTLGTDAVRLEAAKRMIDELNTQSAPAFMLFVRPRKYSRTQGEYTGWERKRGAITEFIRAIRGEPGGFFLMHGAVEDLKKTRYVMALDADTGLTLDCVTELTAAARHPANRAVIDEKAGRVTHGYGVFVPKISIDSGAGYRTPFSSLAAGESGVSFYAAALGERYQDLFGAGSFAGKGLIDVEAYFRVLDSFFPDDSVLSHDILEGELLRAAYVPSAEVTEGFPRSESSYLARLHRWVRGDWQNLVYLGKTVRTRSGRRKNPLTFISRFKLFDSLRRSLTPVAALLLLLFSPFMAEPLAGTAQLLAAFSITVGELTAAFFALLRGGLSALSARYSGKALPAALLKLLQAGLRLIMLPQTALCCADAALRSLARMFITHKNMLSWVTSAQSEQRESGAAACEVLLSLAAALWLFFLSNAFGRLCALFFLGNCFFAPLSAHRRRERPARPDGRTRERLLIYAAELWRYFQKTCDEENHFLPPDNIQEAPVPRVAKRTSPTNIGLMLLSVLAARDFLLIDTPELYERLKRALDTISSLKRWRGNLYNWYDTVTLEPLAPCFVSSVDSGNFLCCLVALRQGLYEYAPEHLPLLELTERIGAILKSTELSAFFNPRRGLFHIGWDSGKGKLTRSHYDLLMSEARMTSYYAVSARLVPKKHWSALSRPLSSKNGYFGPLSWTGTMFEYFMPCLLLPAPANTLGGEALRYCLYCQRLRARELGIPFGFSESGCCRFDAGMNYQYGAHGIRALALKRDLDCEPVVSPYSTFLCLPFAPRTALKNLEALERLGARGSFGFYEAVDFTKSRAEGGDHSLVRSFMAHHVGMSLAALSNALNDGVMQKRFMRDPEMLAGRSLLGEKIPSFFPVFREVRRSPTPERPRRPSGTERVYKKISPLSPRLALYSNGEWTAVLSDCGAGHSVYRGVNVTRQSRDLLSAPQGVFAVFRFGEKALPFCRVLSRRDGNFRAVFLRRAAVFSASEGGAECRQRVLVHPRLPAEIRTFVVRNRGAKPLRGELLFYFEPSLDFQRNEEAHRAYNRLFVSGRKDGGENTVIFRRSAHAGGGPLWCAAGLLSGADFACMLSREAALKRPGGVFSLLAPGRDCREGETGFADVCALLRAPLNVPSKSRRELRFFLCAAPTEAELRTCIFLLRAEKDRGGDFGAPMLFSDGSLESVLGLALLPGLFYPIERPPRQRAALERDYASKGDLWRCGVSGELPLILAGLKEENAARTAAVCLRIFKSLRRAGLRTELALTFFAESRADEKHIFGLIAGAAGAEFSGPPPDEVHILNLENYPEVTKTALLTSAAFLLPEDGEGLEAAFIPYDRCSVFPSEPLLRQRSGADGGIYRITEKPRLPWCYILSNPAFGTLLGDSTLGFSFALNSRENRLTAWNNDTAYDNRGELLFLRLGGKLYDVLSGANALFGEGKARYLAKAEDVRLSVEVSVPPSAMCKRVTAELFSRSDAPLTAELVYYTEPQLGPDRRDADFLHARFDGSSIELCNPRNTAFRGTLRLGTDGEEVFYVNSKADFFAGRWNTAPSPFPPYPCAALGRRLELPPRRREKVSFVLSFGRTPKSAEIVAKQKCAPRHEKNRVEIETPDAELNFLFNRFLPNQIVEGRIYGRAGFYQCGGAYGFRDQLQDVLSVSLTHPKLLRRQLLRCASAQFPEGDVLHWWHVLPSSGEKLGVRTRYSDDLLWLPYVLSEYVLRTGDLGFPGTPVSFLEGEPLSESERERYAAFKSGGTAADLLTHAGLAVERALRLGQHGLLLIGGGDWNDGYNGVGIKGRGESVWLTQFAALVLRRLSGLLERLGECEGAARCEARALSLIEAVDRCAWDRDHYIRAFYDDGTPMGAWSSKECRIDSLSQSFASFCGMPDRGRVRTALRTAYSCLVDGENGLVRLFAPPFSGTDRRAGYTADYPPGLRENGGQYTHAAVWFATALFREGLLREGAALLSLLNPMKKYADESTARRYRTEPYYLCGDIYAAEGLEGHGGWSLYTGSAGWYYSLVLREVLGIREQGGALRVSPRLPELWDGFSAKLSLGGSVIRVAVGSRNPKKMTVDDRPAREIPLDGKNHRVILE